VSDVAAMGARPDGAVVGVAGPPSTDLDLLYEGIAASSEAHGCPVVGGDLSNSAGSDELVIAVAVMGHLVGDLGPVLRGGARAGDHLLVTGPLGAASAGLRSLRGRLLHGPGAASDAGRADPGVVPSDREILVEAAHRRPRARVAEGQTARAAGATAMVDISDGLLADLGHVADASMVGYRLDEVPVSPGATLEDALGGGEDYELVVATPDPEQLATAFVDAGLRPPLPVGRCTADPAERTLAGEPAPRLGWEHTWG
jgi:thiamine-monophosphate kinase